jgi:hypothetical protein
MKHKKFKLNQKVAFNFGTTKGQTSNLSTDPTTTMLTVTFTRG